MKICYVPKTFSSAHQQIIQKADEILEEYAAQGFDLTLRQLYYQFVARGILPNLQTSYKLLGGIINDARLAGHIDWDRIVDRTRNLRRLAHWEDPAEIIRACSQQFRIDKWATQPRRVEVWVEKDALVGVLESVCPDRDIPYFSCRGYTSQSEMWSAAMRIKKIIEDGQQVTILHLGDHDPSGIDMTRDIEERLAIFLAHHIGTSEGLEIRRVALTIDQVEEYNLPPNPAKLSDSRASAYIRSYGADSWELDALDPKTLTSLIHAEIIDIVDAKAWDKADRKERGMRSLLEKCSARWGDVQRALKPMV